MADRELKRNTRGQIVSYEITEEGSSTTPTPKYAKVYLAGPDGGPTPTERFDVTSVQTGIDSVIDELGFRLTVVDPQVDVKTFGSVGVAQEDFVSSGYQSAGNPNGFIGNTVNSVGTGGGGGGYSGGGGQLLGTDSSVYTYQDQEYIADQGFDQFQQNQFQQNQL